MNDNSNLLHQTVTTIALSWALFFARARLAVFPVHFVYDDGGCSCENASCDVTDRGSPLAQSLDADLLSPAEVGGLKLPSSCPVAPPTVLRPAA